jgi:ribosomal protein S18 acetylase RimI-like enzyme
MNKEFIRKATLDDIGELKKVKTSLTDEQIVDRIKRQKDAKDIDYLVYEKDGELVSFVILKWKGKETHPEYPDMEDLHTKESERTKGYATKLIDKCEELAREHGFTKIGLAVNPDSNSYARRLYEKLGYKHDGGKSYLDGIYNGVEDWVIDMEKEL